MPRRKIIRTSELPYHIVSRSNNKDWFRLSMKDSWSLANNALALANSKHPVLIHAFVLMNNHYHLLISTPDENIDKFMQVFNKEFSDTMKRKTNHINRKFGGRYNWSLINNETYLYNVIRYIFQNPIRAHIAEQICDYKYSTLYHEFNRINLPYELCCITEETNLELLEWFNCFVSNDDNDMIRRGLKHSYFQLTKHRDSKYLGTLYMP